MDAVKYFEEKRRMLDSLGRIDGLCDGIKCLDCPFSHNNNGRSIYCTEFQENYPEQAVAIVEKWSQEHPQKTMLQDFLEKYPNAQLDKNGAPCVCPDELGYCEGRCCKPNELDCVACWNRPLEE